jgi:hypothetical protein
VAGEGFSVSSEARHGPGLPVGRGGPSGVTVGAERGDRLAQAGATRGATDKARGLGTPGFTLRLLKTAGTGYPVKVG